MRAKILSLLTLSLFFHAPAQAEVEELAHFFFNDGSAAGTVSVSVLSKGAQKSDFADLLLEFQDGKSLKLPSLIPANVEHEGHKTPEYSLLAWGDSAEEGKLFSQGFSVYYGRDGDDVSGFHHEFQFAWTKDHSSLELVRHEVHSHSGGLGEPYSEWTVVSDLASGKQKKVTVWHARTGGFSAEESAEVPESCDARVANLIQGFPECAGTVGNELVRKIQEKAGK